MRIGLRLISLALLLVLVTAACSGAGSDESGDTPTEVSGPALVMFYTDS